MRIALAIVALGTACLLLSGCTGVAFAPVIPPPAFVFTQYQAPLDVDYQNSPVTGKKGESSCINVLGLVSVGDASARAAAEDANITRIEHADYGMLSVLGIFSKYTTIVYGE